MSVPGPHSDTDIGTRRAGASLIAIAGIATRWPSRLKSDNGGGLVVGAPHAGQGDLRGIVRARQLSEATVRNIRQNLLFAFGYNALGIPLAAGVLYPLDRMVVEPAHRGPGDESFIRLRDRQCAALGERERIRPVTVSQDSPAAGRA